MELEGLFAAHLQIFADYDAQIAEVRASLASQSLTRRPRLNIESCRKTAAKDAMLEHSVSLDDRDHLTTCSMRFRVCS